MGVRMANWHENGRLAQLAERRPSKTKVRCSILLGAIFFVLDLLRVSNFQHLHT